MAILSTIHKHSCLMSKSFQYECMFFGNRYHLLITLIVKKPISVVYNCQKTNFILLITLSIIVKKPISVGVIADVFDRSEYCVEFVLPEDTLVSKITIFIFVLLSFCFACLLGPFLLIYVDFTLSFVMG